MIRLIIQRLKKYEGNAKGNPYTSKDFIKGKLVFDNGKIYKALIRLNVSEQKFEIKKDINSTPSAIKIDQTVKVNIGKASYKLHSFNLGSSTNTIGILEECLILDKYSLFYFPQKKLEMPNKSAIPAPTSGYTKPPRPEWRDNSAYLIFYNNKTYKLPTSHKKMMDLGLFDEKLYKSIYDFLVKPTGNTKPILPPAVLMILSMKLNHEVIRNPYYEKDSYDREWKLSEKVPTGEYTHKQPIQPWSIYDMLSQYVFYYTQPTNCGEKMENVSNDSEGGKNGRKPFVTTLLNRFKATSAKTVVKVADRTLSIGITDLSNALCEKKHLNWSMLNKPLLLLQKDVVKHFGKNLLLQTLAPLTAFLPVEIGYFKLIFGKRFEIYRSAEQKLNILYADQRIGYKEPFVETPDDIYTYLSEYYESEEENQDKLLKENRQKYIKYKIKYLNLKNLNDQ